jgi:hypothetical protein
MKQQTDAVPTTVKNTAACNVCLFVCVPQRVCVFVTDTDTDYSLTTGVDDTRSNAPAMKPVVQVSKLCGIPCNGTSRHLSLPAAPI